MKMSKFLTAIALILVLIVGLTACQFPGTNVPTEPTNTTPTTPTTSQKPVDPTPDHECESVCPTCGLCLDAECAEAVCSAKCEGHQSTPAESTPVITVSPDHIEMNAGQEIDLMFGVTVTDELDEEPKLIIEDDDGFDADVEGTYTITYLAQNKFGKTATATRTIVVNKALSALSLEVQKNLLGENKWQGTILNFKNHEFVTLSENATLDKQSGVFYNASADAITVTISNSDYAVVAIITANGVVIEGRDGANNKLVNAENPVRSSTTAKLANINKVADDMVIPAGGYAIVVQSGYAGTGVDFDGRNFVNYNVIGTYGNVVRLVWADTAEVLTPYVDQAPVISGNNTDIVAGNGFELATGILAGVTAKDDNGTFDPSDDVTVEITVTNDGGFDISKNGVYTITLSATDGTNTTTATRKVEVTTSAVEVIVNGNVHTTVDNLIAVDKDLTVLGKYTFVIYTPNYNGGLNWANGWGEAFVINAYGEVVRIYDGANGKYYDLENPAGVTDASKCTAAGYLTEAFNSRQEGEYLLVAPNGNGNVTRAFLLSNRVIGAKVSLPGVTFAHKCESVCVQCGLCLDAECTDAACEAKCAGHVHNCEDICEVCGKCSSDCDNEVCAAKCDCVTVVVGEKSLKVLAGTIAIDVAAPSLGSYNFVVYTYNFKKDNAPLSWGNGWAQAFILNQYGQVVRIYDGVSGGKYFDAANRAGIVDATITTSGNTLKDAYASLSEGETLILGANGGMNGNAGRGFLGGVRVIGLVATIPGVTFEALPEHTCESKCADCGKCMDATCILPECLAQCACHRCESICAKCNGCLDPACTEKACETKCSCHDCESLCAICGGCKDAECTNEVCAKKCVCALTPETGKYLAINGTSVYFASFYYNEDVTKDTCHKRELLIFDKTYTGTITSSSINGYGVAFVLDATGTFVKAYTWEGIYVYGQDKKAIDYSAGDGSYAARAWSELENGETLIIFANAATTTDVRKTWALPLCSTALGKTAVLTGYTFGQMAAHSCDHVCPACGLCLDAECTEAVCAEKCEGHAHICESTCATCSGCKDAACAEEVCATKCGCLALTIGAKAYTAKAGMWAYNQEITTSTAANKAIWIFDKNYTGNFSTNGYGVAVVLDAAGKVIRVYDGANVGYWLPAGKQASAHFNANTFATVAWSELQEGETLVVLPNGPDGNKARQIGLDSRYLFNQKMNLVSLTYNK